MNLFSFGFKYGVPRGCNYVFDVTFLKNPNGVEGFKGLSSDDARVRDFVIGQECFEVFVQNLVVLIEGLPDPSQVSMGVGCTGGQHRSVIVAEELKSRFEILGFDVTLLHVDNTAVRGVMK